MLFTLNDRHDVHYLFRPWLDTDVKALYNNPASGRVMEKCGSSPTGETAFDSKLYHGADKPIRVMRLVL